MPRGFGPRRAASVGTCVWRSSLFSASHLQQNREVAAHPDATGDAQAIGRLAQVVLAVMRHWQVGWLTMFFFEAFAFVIVFPLCWWLGGRLARSEAPARRPEPAKGSGPDAPGPPDRGEAEVIELAAWRQKHRAGRKFGSRP